MNTDNDSWVESHLCHLAEYGELHHETTQLNGFSFEWTYIEKSSPENFNQLIREAKNVLVPTYTRLEYEFVQINRHHLADEFFLKSIAPLAQAEPVDWQKIYTEIENVFDGFFESTCFSSYTKPGERYICVQVKLLADVSSAGYIQFLISPEMPPGTVKVCYYGVDAPHQDKGLEQALMSIIFKLVPSLEQIILHTRQTNVSLIEKLKSWGFIPDGLNDSAWHYFKYLANSRSSLQDLSRGFKQI